MATIRFETGDILAQDAEALVNTVNCVGFMGRGVALQFKRAFPANFRAYAAACQRGEVQPGRMFVFETGALVPRWIVNFPTKRHWRARSRMEDIEAGLEALGGEIRARAIRSIAIPPLACGLGGLAWDEVRPRIEAALAGFGELDAILFHPDGALPAKDMARLPQAPEMTPARAVLVGLMDRYIAALLDPFLTLLEVHKLLYFMQEAGEPLRLRYTKAARGPYAGNLRHALNRIEGHFIAGYGAGGDAPGKPLELVPGAAREAKAVLDGAPETRARFERVAGLVHGFESSFGLELLATVHWVAAREGAETLDDIVARSHGWHERKKRFSRHQIALAAARLREGGWIGGQDAAAPLARLREGGWIGGQDATAP